MAKGDAGGQKSGEPQCFQGLVRHVVSAMDVQGGEWLRLSLGYQQEGVPDPRWGVSTSGPVCSWCPFQSL